MLGFSATYESGEAAIGDEELQDVRWFTRAEIEAAAAAPESDELGHPRRPWRRIARSRPGWRSPAC